MWIVFRISGNLNKACMVSEGDESNRAMNSMQCNPTAKTDRISYVLNSKRPTAMAPGGPLERVGDNAEGSSVCLLQISGLLQCGAR